MNDFTYNAVGTENPMHVIKTNEFEARYQPRYESITLYEVKDLYINRTTAFTQNKRGIQKAWLELKKEGKNLTFWQAVKFLDDKKLKMHTYCAMD